MLEPVDDILCVGRLRWRLLDQKLGRVFFLTFDYYSESRIGLELNLEACTAWTPYGSAMLQNINYAR